MVRRRRATAVRGHGAEATVWVCCDAAQGCDCGDLGAHHGTRAGVDGGGGDGLLEKSKDVDDGGCGWCLRLYLCCQCC